MKEIKAWKEIKRFENQEHWGIKYEVEGYEIIIHKADYLPGGMGVSITSETDYLPQIYIDSKLGMNHQEIKIQTTAYGALKPEEIGKVMAGYEMALRVAEMLKTEIPEIF